MVSVKSNVEYRVTENGHYVTYKWKLTKARLARMLRDEGEVSMFEIRLAEDAHPVTYNIARKITAATRPPTSPILLPDDWSCAGNCDHRPNIAMQAKAAACVAVNRIILMNER